MERIRGHCKEGTEVAKAIVKIDIGGLRRREEVGEKEGRKEDLSARLVEVEGATMKREGLQVGLNEEEEK